MNRIRLKELFIACFMMLLLSGCSSHDDIPVQMYLLPVSHQPQKARQTAPLLLVKTELAAYLNQPGLVYRTSDTQVIQARHNQWAQRISEQIARHIIQDLRAKQHVYWPVAVSQLSTGRKLSRLVVRVQKFNGVYTGDAEFAGEWILFEPDGKRVKNHSFQLKIPLEESGYSALVNALTKGIGELTDSLADEL